MLKSAVWALRLGLSWLPGKKLQALLPAALAVFLSIPSYSRSGSADLKTPEAEREAGFSVSQVSNQESVGAQSVQKEQTVLCPLVDWNQPCTW